MLVLGEHPEIKGKTLNALLGNVERHVIASVLRYHKGNKSKAAIMLGISRQGLYYKMDAHKIPIKAKRRLRRNGL